MSQPSAASQLRDLGRAAPPATPPAPATIKTGGHRSRAVAAAVLAGLAAGTTGWFVRGALEPAPTSSADVTYADGDVARANLEQRRTDLEAQADAGRELVTTTDGQVADNATREELLAASTAASVLLDATLGLEPSTAVRISTSDEPAPPVVYLDEDWDPGLGAAGERITAATTALEASRATWAFSDLSTVMLSARPVLDASVDQAGEDVRGPLTDALTAAQGIWDAGDGATPAVGILAASDAITAALGPVETARAAWAHGELGSAITAGNDALTTSAGQVTDPAVRDLLYAQLQHGHLVWSAGAGAYSYTDTTAARDAIAAATTNVQSAVALWQQS